MFKKMITNIKQNLKYKNNISSLFNYDSNPSVKTSATLDDFSDITKELAESNCLEKKDINDNEQKESLKKFIKNIVSIIFESRKEKINNSFSLNTSKDSENSNFFDDRSFSLEVDDLFLCNDIYKERNGLQKLIIEFYLTKKIGSIKIKELVEKWRITYNFDEMNTNYQNIQDFNNKINLYTKSIISYTRLLPLYQFIISNRNNNNYSLDFKFYQNKYKKKGKFLEKPSGKVSLKNSELFSFKLKIKYYNLDELNNIFEKEGNNEYDCLSNKPRSLSLHKAKINLNGFESLNTILNDNNPINEINNDEKRIKACHTGIDKEKIKDMDSDSDGSSFYLVLDSDEENKKTKDGSNLENDKDYNKAKRKFSFFSNFDEITEECDPRNSNSTNYFRTNQNGNEENISPFSSRKSSKKIENDKINNILKDYTSLKNMLDNLDSSIFIKTDEFKKYTNACG